MAAEKILSEANCDQLSASLLAFIRINELPQMIHNKLKIPQLKSLSFFIKKAQRSAIDIRTSHFFYIVHQSNNGYGKNFIERYQHKGAKRF